jgi:hypothetical protein
MKRWSWLAILAIGFLSLGAAYAESRACTPNCDQVCDPTTCVPSTCQK